MSDDLAGDIVEGGHAIAKFLFGDDRPEDLRKVYRLTTEVAPDKRLPFFKLGAIVCLRKSTMIRRIEEQERAAIGAI